MNMETLDSAKLLAFPWPNLVRIGDLVNFEGPMLTLFFDREREVLFLYDWVDSDHQYNRWLIFQGEPRKILEFVNQRISHYELFATPVEPYYYSVDIDGNLNFTNYRKIMANQVPQAYYPDRQVFFDPSDCPNLGKIREFLEAILEGSKQEDTNQGSYANFWHLALSPQQLFLNFRENLMPDFIVPSANQKDYPLFKRLCQY